MTATDISTPDPSGKDRALLVEQLLAPSRPMYDLAQSLAVVNEGTRSRFEKLKAERQAERMRLMALPLNELKDMRARQLQQAAAQKAAADAAGLRRKTEAAAKEASKEAGRIYNQPTAEADFEHWAKMDHWTFDEALVLLLGKDPRIVTRSVVKEELFRDQGYTLFAGPRRPKSAFLRSYEDLRQLAERATVLKGPRLRPVDVLVWAHRTGAIVPPAHLVRSVSNILDRAKTAQAQPSTPIASHKGEELPAPAASSTLPIKRAALVKKHERIWPSIESDLKHANENGLQAAAKGDGRGMWIETRALEWAEQRGKLTRSNAIAHHAAHSPFGRIHDSDS